MFENAIDYVTTSANAIRLVLSVVASFMILAVALVTEKIAFSTTAPYIEVVPKGARSTEKSSKKESGKKEPAKKEVPKKPKIMVM
jgi:hypothetical protein